MLVWMVRVNVMGQEKMDLNTSDSVKNVELVDVPMALKFSSFSQVKGPPQPVPCSNLTYKKKFSLDLRKHHFVTLEEKATAEMLQMKHKRDDIHFVYQPPEGHRENTVDVKGISDVYQLRALRRAANNSEPIIYLREDVCCCKFCVVSDYDRCVKGVLWKACDGISPEKDVVRQQKIVEFYHYHNWNASQTYFAEKPPLVAIQSEEHGLLLGLLTTQPFKLEAPLHLKDIRKSQAVKFRAAKGTWCLKIDLFEIPNGVELSSNTYIINDSIDFKNIIVPVYEIIMPDPISTVFYAYSEFISCTLAESFRKHDDTEEYSRCYKINRRSMTTLLDLR